MGTGNLTTAEELERMGTAEDDLELVRGELVPMRPGGAHHGMVAATLVMHVGNFLRTNKLGRAYALAGFVLRRDPDTVLAPDLGFVSRSRFGLLGDRRGFVQGPPDLAVEIRSFDETLGKLLTKAEEYTAAGSPLVWVVDPNTRRVRVYRSGEKVEVLRSDDTLDGGQVLPGFSLPLSQLFEDLD